MDMVCVGNICINTLHKGDNDDDDDDNKLIIIPVITRATGTISKSFRKYLSKIPGNHEVKELQKTAILGTTHILRKILT